MVAGREFQNLSIRDQNYLSRFKIMRHVRGGVGGGGGGITKRTSKCFNTCLGNLFIK